MTHLLEMPELPELPSGEDLMDRTIAFLIILVACLAAFAAYLEVKSATREATADRNAKIEMLAATGAQINISTAASIAALTVGEAHTWEALADSLRTARMGEARRFGSAHIAASDRAVIATKRKVLAGEAQAGPFTRDFYFHDELARAYERERDARTSQVTRFITVITDFAVALFLLGLIARVPRRARWYFLAVPTLAAALTFTWAVYIARTAAPRPNTRAVQLYAQGRIAFDHGFLDRSIGLLTSAIGLEHGFAAAYRERGDGYLVKRNWSKAQDDLSKAAKLDSKDFFAMNDLAAAYWQQHDYKRSFAAIEEASKVNDVHPVLAFNRLEGLAATSDKTGKYGAALARYRTVLGAMGREAATNLELSLVDIVESAHADRTIAPQMTMLCRDLERTATTLGMEVKGLTCEPLPGGTVHVVWKSAA